jgi:hypothetical protein
MRSLIYVSVGCLAIVGLLLVAGLRSRAMGLEGAIHVSGSVRNIATGLPVVNAEVYIEGDQSGQAAKSIVGPSGTFDMRGPQSTATLLVVRANGYAPYRQSIRASMTDLDIAMDPEAVVRGKLFSAETGAPLEGTVASTTEHPRNWVRESGRSIGGAFELRELLPGMTTVVARAEGMAPAIHRSELRAGERRDGMMFKMVKAASVSGQVFNADGSPSVGSRLSVRYDLPADDRMVLEPYAGGRLTTNKNGEFFVRNLVPSVGLTLVIDSSGRQSRSERMSLSAGQLRTGMRITLPSR